MFSNNRLKFLLTAMTVSNLGLVGMSQTFRKAWTNQKEENEKLVAYFSSLLEKHNWVPDENDLAILRRMGIKLKGDLTGVIGRLMTTLS
jgi:hypothetical protein